MSKVLVTGATGNVGSSVAEYLMKLDQQVIVAGRNVKELSNKFGTEAVYFDFTDPNTFKEALKDVDRVFIVRPPQLGNPEDLFSFIKALKEKGNIQLVCFLSLIGIQNNPIPPHYKIEKYIEKSELPYCHIRPGFFMQNLSGIHAFEIKHFDRIVVPVARSLTSFIDAEDIGEIIANILTNWKQHQNIAYDLTGSEAIDYYKIAEILSQELGREILYTNPKPSFAQKYWTNIRGLDKNYATVMGMLYLMTRMGTAKKVTDDFERIMGKSPRSFVQFAQKNRDVWIK